MSAEDWAAVEECLFGYSGSGPIPDARGSLARLRQREEELSKTVPPRLLDQIRLLDRAEAAEARVQKLETVLRACGDVLFAPWDDDQARQIASRKAEALARAALEPRAEA